MTSDPEDAYVLMLSANLQRVLDFVKFAEAKNAALLALASAWIGATLNLECTGKVLPSGFVISVPAALIFALCAALTAMISFLPRLHLPSFLGGKRAGPHPTNLLYFGDISTLPIRSLETEMRARYLSAGQGYRDEFIHDLTVQILVNSEITMRKMRLFSWGLRLILCGGLALLIPSLRLAFVAIRNL